MNLLATLVTALILIVVLGVIGFSLAFIFGYCFQNRLKKVYKAILIVILIIIGIADYSLINKEFPMWSLVLFLFQVIAIPIIAWCRPEYDFSDEKKKEEERALLAKSISQRCKPLQSWRVK